MSGLALLGEGRLMLRTRTVVCRSHDGREYLAHWYGPKREQGRRLCCRRCGDSITSHKNTMNARWMMSHRRRRMAAGRCFQCGASPLKSCDLCARCYNVRLNRQRAARAEAKRAGLCRICHRVCDANHGHCAACREARRRKNRALALRGICPNCRRPNDRQACVYCTECAAKRASILRRAYHDGRVRVRATPRGKQRALVPEVVATPLTAVVYLEPPGSLARLFASVPMRAIVERGST